jgi:hypothetical protein
MVSLIIKTYESMMHRYLETKHMIPSNQLIEVKYEKLAANPVEEMEMIYEKFNLGNFNQVRNQVNAFLQEAKSYERASYKLRPQERTLIENNWQPFLQRYTN